LIVQAILQVKQVNDIDCVGRFLISMCLKVVYICLDDDSVSRNVDRLMGAF